MFFVIFAAFGYLELPTSREQGYRRYAFRIAHNGPASPRNPNKGSYVGHPSHSCLVHAYTPKSRDGGFHLDDVVGPNGLQVLLAMVDRGRLHQPTFNTPNVVDVREWAELMRRLAIPYYEEARLYWEKAGQAGYFEGMNEFCIYQSDTLQEVINKFVPQEDDSPSPQ